jgi:hypothetical protein
MSPEYIAEHQHLVDTGADNFPITYDEDEQCFKCGIYLDNCDCLDDN